MRVLSLNSLWFVIAITLNALGNSFMIISNLGSAPWTSAAENLEYLLPFSVGVCIIILYFFAMLLSYFMKIKFTVGMIVKTIALSVIFGVFIDLFLYLHQMVYVPNDLGIRYIYLFIGLNLIAVAICIYFQASSIYLPSDYLLKAFGKLMNNYTTGTILCTAIPLSISIIIIIYRQSINGIGPGTLMFMFGMGLLIDIYNRWIVINKTPEKLNQIS
ncbi:hypothetical protein [Lentibacillus sp. CBA3610]|uniref:hypothetical protein n=1 Tax=Lentibacillus sp. CBA3610 TaxID=2518176 RepID=UPI0015962EA2|nr:hypothetical protein [Lentibacillus sp. CBA3610]QKY68330.1 hypothetical protein Len3610_00680 [Lentibacillus sp. CBA3610]